VQRAEKAGWNFMGMKRETGGRLVVSQSKAS